MGFERDTDQGLKAFLFNGHAALHCRLRQVVYYQHRIQHARQQALISLCVICRSDELWRNFSIGS